MTESKILVGMKLLGPERLRGNEWFQSMRRAVVRYQRKQEEQAEIDSLVWGEALLGAWVVFLCLSACGLIALYGAFQNW